MIEPLPQGGAHSKNDKSHRDCDDSQHDPASETVDQSSDADREQRANQGGPEIYARECDAIDLQISE